jgi:hypothetical protein
MGQYAYHALNAVSGAVRVMTLEGDKAGYSAHFSLIDIRYSLSRVLVVGGLVY